TTPLLGSVSQYAANYVDLPQADGSVTFNGDTSVALVDAPLDGGAWWSNRGDSMDTRLTRHVDLTGLTRATLRFQAWFDLENQFAFVYLSAAGDGGRTWHVVPGQNTKPDQATGNNYGEGWTGSSGGVWVDEAVDLSPLAGSDVLLRFEYVTDQSYNGPGFALRNLAIPESGLNEPGAIDDPWTAEGWVRIDAPVPERWNLRLVRWRPDGVIVDSLGVALDGVATFPLDPTATRSTLVIAPTAPRTLVSANYTVTLQP